MAKFPGLYPATNYLNWLKGTTYPAAPSNTYLALYTVAPTARDGTGGTEVSTSGTAYARQAISSAAWSAIGTSGSGDLITSGEGSFAGISNL